MSRFKFIFCLILFAVSLHFFANNLRSGLQLTQAIGMQYAAQNTRKNIPASLSDQTPNTASLWNNIKKQFKKLSPQKDHIKLISISREEPLKEYVSQKPIAQNSSSFLQVTLEELRPPLKNKTLGPEASARLDLFLQERRARNADLANETEPLFGARAKREVMRVLINDEKESYNNARESKSAKEFSERQTNTDEKTRHKLNEIFERHKKLFNLRLTESTPAWNKFFRQVNNFQKAED